MGVAVAGALAVEDGEVVKHHWVHLDGHRCPCSGGAFVGFAGRLVVAVG